MAGKWPQRGGSINWNDSKWSHTQGGPANVMPPAQGEDIFFEALSADVTVNGDLTDRDFALLDMDAGGSTYTGTLDLGAQIIDVDGNVVLAGTITATTTAGGIECEGNLTKTAGTVIDNSGGEIPDIVLNGATGNITCNTLVQNGGNFTIVTGSDYTQVDKFFADSIAVEGTGTITGHADGADIVGNIIFGASASWPDSNTVTMTGTGTVTYANTAIAARFDMLVIGAAGEVTTLGSSIGASGFTLGAGTVTDGASSFFLNAIIVANGTFIQHVSSILMIDELRLVPNSGSTQFEVGCVKAQQVTSGVTIQNGGNNGGIVMTADWNLGTRPLIIRHGVGTLFERLDTNDHNLVCGQITLGTAGAGNGAGKIDFASGSHTIAGLAAATGNNDSDNEISFDTSTVHLGDNGLIDGDSDDALDINANNTSGRVFHGTINNLIITGTAPLEHFWPTQAGTGNTDVIEINLTLRRPYAYAY